jgi:PilZ domain-containing protein/FHA domain-containing protein
MDRRRQQRGRTSRSVGGGKSEKDRRRGDRRRQKRVAAEVMVEVETSGRRTYRRTANISAGGIGFHAPIPFRKGSNVFLTLQLAGRGSAVRVKGEVVGCDKNGRGTRVKFLEMSADARESLEEHLKLFSVPTRIGAPPSPLLPRSRPLGKSVREGILIVEEDAEGTEFRLRSSDKIIGRDPRAVDFFLDHQSVSRKHAHIYMQNGRHVITDLSSTNGLRFKGKTFHSLVLKNGMVFKVGQIKLQYLVTKTV